MRSCGRRHFAPFSSVPKGYSGRCRPVAGGSRTAEEGGGDDTPAARCYGCSRRNGPLSSGKFDVFNT
jgi:hypothetical protein